jgi:hypothetical protein
MQTSPWRTPEAFQVVYIAELFQPGWQGSCCGAGQRCCSSPSCPCGGSGGTCCGAGSRLRAAAPMAVLEEPATRSDASSTSRLLFAACMFV